MSEDERAIRDLVERWMATTKAGDAATVLGLMSDDVVFMVPGAEPFGKAAFAAALAGMKGMTIEAAARFASFRWSATSPGCAAGSR